VQCPENNSRVIKIKVSIGAKPLISLPKVASLFIKCGKYSSRIAPLIKVGALATSELTKKGLSGLISIQVEDQEPRTSCLRFDSSINDIHGTPMIPDPYCLATNGFSDLVNEFENTYPLPPWKERIDLAIWRGATTGGTSLDENNIRFLPRYLLCIISSKNKSLLDAKFSYAVESKSPIDQEKILTFLSYKRILSNMIRPREFALYKWIIDIDGSVNSWGLLWKLLSGSCILRVLSKRKQWYYHMLNPMEHYVPIKEDMSDLKEKLVWCKDNQDICNQIAYNGKQLARQVVRDLDLSLSDSIELYINKLIHGDQI